MPDSADESSKIARDTEPGLIPYASRAVREPSITIHRIGMAGLMVALAAIIFNLWFALWGFRHYQAAQALVYDRSPGRRAIMVVTRGRPEVFPSKVRLTLFLLTCAGNVALAAWLARCAWLVLRADQRGWAALQAYARVRLWTAWISALAAIFYAWNLSRVYFEFAVLGDFLMHTFAIMTAVALGSALLALPYPLSVLLMARTIRRAQR